MSRPRVLISYFFGDGKIPLGTSCARALRELGCEVHCFDSTVSSPWDRYLLRPINKLCWAFGFKRVDVAKSSRLGDTHYREDRLAADVALFRPDILLVINGHGFDGDFLQRLKERHGISKLVGWWVKGPKWFDIMHRDAALYDRYFCIHKEDYVEGEGIRHLPALALDDVLYRRIGTSPCRTRGIVFVGAWNERRQRFLERITDLPLEIHGPGWRQKNLLKPAMLVRIKSRGLWADELVRAYNEARIVLNVSAWDVGRRSGLNLRIMDVPACGAFLLTDHSNELSAWLQPGEEAETFRDAAEMAARLRRYLSDDEAREKIAERGYRRARSMPTYRDLMAKWLEMLDD